MSKLRNIKKIALSSAVAAPAALGLSMNVHAATTADTAAANPYSISVGASFLTDKNSSDAVSNTGFHVGLGYAFDTQQPATSGTPSIDLDYDNYSGHGNYLDTYGAFLTDRFELSSETSSGVTPYVGAGLGLAYIQGKKSETTRTTYPTVTVTTKHVSHSVTNFAGKLLAGVNFGQSFAEVDYEINGSDEGLNDDTIDLSIGTHF